MIKKKKKPYSSITYTTGDPIYNMKQFNKSMGMDFNNPSTEEAKSSSLNSSEVSSAATNEQIILDKNKKLNEAKRYVRRYYIRPQNVFCSNKNDILQRLIEFEDQNCSIYTLNNLGDTKDVTKLTNKDIIYYYDDGILYDKNKIRIMDYDLYIKKEEDRKQIDPESVSDATFADVYSDRITDLTRTDEEFNLHFDSVNAYGEVLKESKPTNYTIRDIEHCANNIAKAKRYKLCNYGDIREVVEFTDRGTILIAMCDNDAENDYECTHCLEMSVDEFWSYLEKPLTEAKTNICCICGEEINGYGNNPEPYKLAKHGERCCDSCNMKFVVPMRLEQMQDELED